MQAQGSQQVSLRAPRPVPGSAGSVRAFAGVAQLVEHLFCKQVVSGSIPLASSGVSVASATAPQFVQIPKASEGCPSGQREQAVNLPAHAYVGSNPTPSTSNLSLSGCRSRSSLGLRRTQAGFGVAKGTSAPASRLGARAPFISAGVTQLVESQFSKLKVEGSSPFSRSRSFVSSARAAASALEQPEAPTRKPTRLARKIARRPSSLVNVEASNAHLAQMVEHVLGKDEVTSSILVVGSNRVQP
jgi:hypothetical protein